MIQLPNALEHEPLRADESRYEQAARADYVNGWNACLAAVQKALSAAPSLPAQSEGEQK